MSSYFSSLQDRANLYTLAALGDLSGLQDAKKTHPYAWKRVRRVMEVTRERLGDPDDIRQLLAVIDPSLA